jgi:hypothetical protein
VVTQVLHHQLAQFLVLVFDFGQFKSIKPNTTTAFGYIDLKVAEGPL